MSDPVRRRDLDERREIPQIAELKTPEVEERRQYQLTLFNVAALTLMRLSEKEKRKLTRRDVEAVVRGIRTGTLEQLRARVFAIQQRSPGLLAQAMQASGFKVTMDEDGGVHIGVDQQSLIGRPITLEEFEAEEV